jgi:hypothetical protein
MHLSGVKMQLTEQALSSPKVQGAIAASTMAVGVEFTVAKWLPELLSVVSMGLGCVLTIAFIVHRIVLIIKDIKEID